MLKSQLVYEQKIIFDILLNNLLRQFDFSSTYSCNLDHAHACIDALSYSISIVQDVGSQQSLRLFKDQIPDSADREIDKIHWCQNEYLVWMEELETAVYLYRSMHPDCHCNSDREILDRYCKANQIIIEAIELNYKITVELRQEIETVLLPSDRQLMIEKQSETNQKSIIFCQ